MADIEKVRVGDELKVTCKVIYLHEDKSNGVAGVKVSCRGIHGWLTDEDVEAAEHIPAPKVFKRGDWVFQKVSPQLRRGIVLDGPRDGGGYSVSWPGVVVPIVESADFLEHDEAPE